MDQYPTSQSYLNRFDNGNSSINDLALQLKDQNNMYKTQFQEFLDQYTTVMDSMLKNKNKDTGNIFTNFMNGYKETRNKYNSDFLYDMFPNIFRKQGLDIPFTNDIG